MWLVWIDAFSNYGGIERVKSADGLSTIRKLTEVFSLFGNPEKLVADNGTPRLLLMNLEHCAPPTA